MYMYVLFIYVFSEWVMKIIEKEEEEEVEREREEMNEGGTVTR